MYHDPHFIICYKSYQYYGQHTLNKDIDSNERENKMIIDIDRGRINIEDQLISNQFLDGMKDLNCIQEKDKFIKLFFENKEI